MFVAMVFLIWAWATSLQSKESFDFVVSVMQSVVGYIFTLGIASLLLYHFIGGVRHLVMDMGYWEELESGNTSANIAIGLWIVLTIVIGVVLW
jgi:succinate dehydrogenase / fumarate reductase cytochrome b subunit